MTGFSLISLSKNYKEGRGDVGGKVDDISKWITKKNGHRKERINFLKYKCNVLNFKG